MSEENRPPKPWRYLNVSLGRLLDVPVGDVVIPVAITSIEAKGSDLVIGRKLAVIREVNPRTKDVKVTYAGVKMSWARVDTGEIAEEVINGFEYGGKYVAPDGVSLKPDGTVRLSHTVDVGEVAPMFIDSAHIIWPTVAGAPDFDVFVEALRQEKLAAIGTVVLVKNTRQIVLMWQDRPGQLVAFLTRQATGVKAPEMGYIASEASERDVPDREGVKAARTLLRKHAAPYEPQAEDDYQVKLLAAVQKAADGGTPTGRQEPSKNGASEKLPDMLAHLRKQVATASKPKRPARKPTGRK